MMSRFWIGMIVCLVGCTATPTTDQVECPVCPGTASPAELQTVVEGGYEFKACPPCRSKLAAMDEASQEAWLAKFDHYRCTGCPVVKTVPTGTRSPSCCGHHMVRQ